MRTIVTALLLASGMSILAGVLSWGYYSEGFSRYAAVAVGAPFIAAGWVASDALAVALGFAMYVLFFLAAQWAIHRARVVWHARRRT